MERVKSLKRALTISTAFSREIFSMKRMRSNTNASYLPEEISYSNAFDLPEEIMRNILKRLPVKSLIRFQCVCKYFKNLVKDPSFIADHLQHSTHQNPRLLFECKAPLQHHFHLLDCRFQCGDAQKAPVSRACFVDSCNGLICLEILEDDKYPPSFLLWNPATSALRHVPVSKRHALPTDEYETGFGFSEVVNDFKIVITYELLNRAVVFSLKRGAWKSMDFGNLEHVILDTPHSFTFNGAIFWIAIDYSGETDVLAIVSFDVAKEVFSMMPGPGIYANVIHYSNGDLTVYENKLALLCRNWEETPSCIDLWVLDEGTGASGKTWSWTKIYSTSPFVCTLSSKAILGNEIVCELHSKYDTEEGTNVLCVMNVATNEVKRLYIPCGSYIYSIFNYVESLVSVGND